MLIVCPILIGQNLIYNNNDINDCYGKFISAITHDYEKCFSSTRQSRRASFKYKKWITNGLKVNCKMNEKLYKKWINSKSKSDELNYHAYKKIHTKVAEQQK